MNESLAIKATGLYAGGLTFGKISQELEISKGRVGALIREGITTMTNNSLNTTVAPVVQPDSEQMNTLENRDLGLPIYDEDLDYDGILEKSFLVKATPILRKVALNPRIFFYFDYATKRFGWEGDIGDFLIECVEYFWKSKGYSIRVTYEEDLA